MNLWRIPLVILLGSLGPSSRAEELKLNQMQVIGSHNSYHVAPAPAALKYLGSMKKEWAEALDYTHRPLSEQFGKLGIRQVELDVFADPVGGVFANPLVWTKLKAEGQDPGPDPNPKGILNKPGFKVLHIPDIDYRSTVPTLDEALGQIRAWSRAHAQHVPILVMIEVKDTAVPLLPTKPVKFDAALLDALDAAILRVFDRKQIFTPDDLRGQSKSLPQAIAQRGWPKIDDLRGQVVFALDNEGGIRQLYLEKHPALKGRVMFCSAPETDPAAAWFKINDPIAEFDRIQKLVKAGYLVRTRADAETREARKNDTTRRDKALASGAQFVSSDFLEPRKEWSDYRVALPGGVPARPNPVSAPKAKDVLEPRAQRR